MFEVRTIFFELVAELRRNITEQLWVVANDVRAQVDQEIWISLGLCFEQRQSLKDLGLQGDTSVIKLDISFFGKVVRTR